MNINKKTVKITEEAYQILADIKWATRSKTYSEVIVKMDNHLQMFTPKDSVINRSALRRTK